MKLIAVCLATSIRLIVSGESMDPMLPDTSISRTTSTDVVVVTVEATWTSVKGTLVRSAPSAGYTSDTVGFILSAVGAALTGFVVTVLWLAPESNFAPPARIFTWNWSPTEKFSAVRTTM